VRTELAKSKQWDRLRSDGVSPNIPQPQSGSPLGGSGSDGMVE
jgi:hypothetical protein